MERVDFLDKKDYEGPLCEQIDNAYNFILNHLNMAIEINGIVHNEKYELPSYAKIGDKSATNQGIGDKSAINQKIGDKCEKKNRRVP